jgi:ABC-type cobalamin transport system ATPase subunit
VLMIKQGQLLKEGLAKEVMTADNLGDLYDMNLKMASLEGEKKVVFA